MQDLIFAARLWRKRPAVTAAIVLALAFGVAATSIAFSVLNAFFLRPLPVREPDRLVRVYSSVEQGIEHFTLSRPDIADIRDLTAVFAGVVAEEPVAFSLAASGAAERIYGERIAGGYFSVLGVRPVVGRFPTPAEESAAGPSSVAVLSAELWQRRFGADAAIVGATVSLNGRPHEIIGVAPQGFRGITAGVKPEIWCPAADERGVNRGSRGWFGAAPAVAIVNEELARRFWPPSAVEGPGSPAVGRRLVTASGGAYHVIGVVRGHRYLTLGEDPKPQLYLAFRQSGARAATVVLRTSGDERTALARLRATVQALDPMLPPYNVSTMEERVRVALLPAIAGAASVSAVGIIALLLVGLGLYGSVVQAVAGREQEIGVRCALGAGRTDVLWLVVRQAAGLVALGALAGFAAGVVSARVLQALVYAVSPSDPLVITGAPVVLLIVCAAAACAPALAALRIDTARALRSE